MNWFQTVYLNRKEGFDLFLAVLANWLKIELNCEFIKSLVFYKAAASVKTVLPETTFVAHLICVDFFGPGSACTE
jgi:hypothetical protein